MSGQPTGTTLPGTIPHQKSNDRSAMEMSLHVHCQESDLVFQEKSDYVTARRIPNYFQVTVQSAEPATLAARLLPVAAIRPGAATDKLSGLTSIFESRIGQLRLNSSYVSVIRHPGSLLPSVYYFDLIVDPPLDVPQGYYRPNVEFVLNRD